MLTTQSRMNGSLFEYLEFTLGNIATVHQPILLLCAVIFLITFGITIYLIVEHRSGLDTKKEHFHKSVYIEIMWAVIPFLIIFCLICPIFVTVFDQ